MYIAAKWIYQETIPNKHLFLDGLEIYFLT